MSSPPELEFRPLMNAVLVVAISIYIYSAYIYILFISKRVRGHYGELISVKNSVSLERIEIFQFCLKI